MAEERLDLVIFGATGFTGKYTVKEAQRLGKDNNFSWGVAGRRKEALESVIKEFAPESENIPVIIADLKDEESIKKMAEQAKVIVNCCGPYRFYGETVIKACIAARTHHVDVSGEVQWMETMQLKYHKAAEEAGIYIVSACGFDSIPCDLGIAFTQNKFGGEINSIETYVYMWNTSKTGGPSIHYGTWESLLHEITHISDRKAIRDELFPDKLPELKPKLKSRSLIHQNPIGEGWATFFPGSDKSVCYRTQRFQHAKYKQRPIQIQTYLGFKKLFDLFLIALLMAAIAILSKFEFTRNLMLKYPKLFTGGQVSHEGPKPEKMENTHFTITFIAKGWTEKLSEPTDQHKEPPNKEVITKVTGTNPGYGATCTCLMIAALMALKESDKMPENGGVLPPGAAFAKTSIVEELNKNGVKFELVSSIEK